MSLSSDKKTSPQFLQEIYHILGLMPDVTENLILL